jgi:transcriptional regulator with XRE-family HTH domain
MTKGAVRPQAAAVLRTARAKAGLTQRQLGAAAGTSQAAIARYEAGAVLPDLRTLARLVEACGFHLVLDLEPQRQIGEPGGRTGQESAVMRPPAIPHDLEDPSIDKASGVVELPLRVQWSGRRRYDLSDRRDRARVYELVLREGTHDDVRRFVRLDHLEELWEELLLPPHVRAAWEQRITKQRGG